MNAGSNFRIELPPAYRQFIDDGEEILERDDKRIDNISDMSVKSANVTGTARKISSRKNTKNDKMSKKSREVRTPLRNYLMSRRRFYKMMESKMNR